MATTDCQETAPKTGIQDQPPQTGYQGLGFRIDYQEWNLEA